MGTKDRLHLWPVLLFGLYHAALGRVVDHSNKGYTTIPSIPSDATELYLNDNKLKAIPANAFSGLNSLWKLKLTNNPIETFSEDAFRGLPVVNLELSIGWNHLAHSFI